MIDNDRCRNATVKRDGYTRIIVIIMNLGFDGLSVLIGQEHKPATDKGQFYIAALLRGVDVDSLQAIVLGSELDGDLLRLSRAGLLRVDALLPLFFEPEFRGIRYT